MFFICAEAPIWQTLTVLCFSAPSVVRSGDYYLFETDSEEEEEEEEKKEDDPQKKSAFQVTSGFQMSRCLQLDVMIILTCALIFSQSFKILEEIC